MVFGRMLRFGARLAATAIALERLRKLRRDTGVLVVSELMVLRKNLNILMALFVTEMKDNGFVGYDNFIFVDAGLRY